jgi:hypothetical protein
MHYNRLNNLVGWFVFLIATAVYFMTIEDTASLWDCGEYITAAYKLEVGHPPGAPLFMVLGRLFSFFTAPENVAMWINRMSALSSSFTILFMFWSITMLAKKIVQQRNRQLTFADQIAILGSGVIGSLAYTFSDTFWFSAVEGEVYAMASLFTAVIFWAILKWDSEMNAIKHKELSGDHSPLRWIILIMFLFGLAIGVHLLGLLAIPAVVYIIYFNVTQKVRLVSFLIIGLVGVLLLSLIQDSIIPNVVGNASGFEVFFTNSLGLPFNTGAIFYILLLVFLLLLPFMLKQGKKAHMYYLISLVPVLVLLFSGMSAFMWVFAIVNIIVAIVVYNSNDNPYQALIFAYFTFILGPVVYYFVLPENSVLRNGKTAQLQPMIFNAMKMVSMGLIMLLIGYGSFAVIVIRSNANTPLDENDPENLVTLQAYLKREQYGSWPIVYGNYWNSKLSENPDDFGDLSPFYLRRYVVQRGDVDIKGFRSEAEAKKFAAQMGRSYEVKEKYFMSNSETRKGQKPAYQQNTILPRMWWTMEPNKIAKYKEWSGYTDEPGEGSDGLRLPTFGENLKYMFSYQMNWMYWRYFMWNFAGRQNDIRGHGDDMRGNWVSGVNFIDNMRLGNQDYLPTYTADNEAHNRFFFLPLILGLIGLLFHFYRAPKDAFTVFLIFLFTGIAIIVFLNQKPLEPRERDYAFAASFYAFSMWIGLSVLALYEAFRNVTAREIKWLAYIGGGGLVFFLLFGGATAASWFFVFVLAAALIALMRFLGRSMKSQTGGAAVAFLLTLGVPVLMAFQGWDDHDRSGKTSARDLAHNYLESCAKNSVIFTTGDNDTFPLWYYQEVEGKRTDVRVCNLSLMQTDWYTEQMMRKAYESDPLPITWREDQILAGAGNTEQILFAGIFDLAANGVKPEVLKPVFEAKKAANMDAYRRAYEEFRRAGNEILAKVTSKDASFMTRLNQVRGAFVYSADSSDFQKVSDMNNGIIQVFEAYSSGLVTAEQNDLMQLQQVMQAWEDSWDFMPLKDAMDFVKNDDNMIENNGRRIRVFPTKGFILPVNADNAVASGIITEAERSKCETAIRFRFNENGLQKEQIMMLDMIANNNWKRAVYYSSPAGQDVAMAILNSGHLRQNGMAWELSPIRTREMLNDERMYKNLMEVYWFGDMKNSDVLTDNYARDQTGPMRSQFLQLAEYYVTRSEQMTGERDFYNQQLPALRANGMGKRADSLAAIYANTDRDVASFKQRAINLVKRSIEVMPPENVIDYGEPNVTRDSLVGSDGLKYPVYNDGTLHKYVEILYRAGDRKTAGELGMKVAAQLETIINFFVNSDPGYSGNHLADVASATNNYALLYGLSNDKELGDPSSPLARRTKTMMASLYGTHFPQLLAGLREITDDEDSYSSVYDELKGSLDGIGISVGILPAPANAGRTPMMPGNSPEMPVMPNDVAVMPMDSTDPDRVPK